MPKAFLIAWFLFLCGVAAVSIEARETTVRLRLFAANQAQKHEREVAVVARHARELLGPKQTVPFAGPDGSPRTLDLSTAVHQWTRRELKGVAEVDTDRVSSAILEESLRHGFDPVFLLAVIQRESKFNALAVGSHGEIGLMQLRPATAEWIAQKFHLPWHGADTLKNPVNNIQLGAAYLSFLRSSFKKRGTLYLSAYNMGPKKTREWMRENVTPKEYATEVISNYVRFHEELSDIL